MYKELMFENITPTCNVNLKLIYWVQLCQLFSFWAF